MNAMVLGPDLKAALQTCSLRFGLKWSTLQVGALWMDKALSKLLCDHKALSTTPRCQQPCSVCILDTISHAQKMNKNPIKTASASLPTVLKVKMKSKDMSRNLCASLTFPPELRQNTRTRIQNTRILRQKQKVASNHFWEEGALLKSQRWY